MTRRDDCGRTAGFIDRIVDGTATDEDLTHAASCPSCGPLLARASRFDDELRRTAQRLVNEDLPVGILDERLAEVDAVSRGRGVGPSLATGAVAVAIAVIATALALRPPAPGGSATPPSLSIAAPSTAASNAVPTDSAPSAELPTLVTSSSLAVRLVAGMNFRCGPSQPLPTSGPRAGAAIREYACVAPAEPRPFNVAIIVGSSTSGDVVTVEIKAELTEQDTPAAREAVALLVSKLAGIPFASESDTTRAASFIAATLPGLEVPSRATAVDVGDAQVDVERLDDGSYLVHIGLRSPLP